MCLERVKERETGRERAIERDRVRERQRDREREREREAVTSNSEDVDHLRLIAAEARPPLVN